MGKIHLEDMEFFAFHGCYKEEQITGNNFLVNVSIDTNTDKPAETDNIADALNYQTVYEIVKEQMGKKSYLIEHVCKRILDSLYEKFDTISFAEVKVSKLNPPIGGKMRNVNVTISR